MADGEEESSKEETSEEESSKEETSEEESSKEEKEIVITTKLHVEIKEPVQSVNGLLIYQK